MLFRSGLDSDVCSSDLDNDVIKEKKSKWSEYFGNSNPIAVEIGTGSGNFMYQLAERNPNKNFIGFHSGS